MEKNTMSLNEYFSKDSIFRMSEDSEDSDEDSYSGYNVHSAEEDSESGDVSVTSVNTSNQNSNQNNTLTADDTRTDLRDVKGRRGACLLQIPKQRDLTKNEEDSNTDEHSYNLVIEQGGILIECAEQGIKIMNTGGKRDGRTMSLVVDRSLFTGVNPGVIEKPLLEGRKSRSSSEIREEKESMNMVWFSAKYNNLFKPKAKSLSMINLRDIDNDSCTSSKRRFCFQSFKSKLKEMFSPQRIVLHSQFVMMEEHGRHIGGIHASTGNACWLFYRGGSQIALVTHEGAILQHMKITHAIDDLTVDRRDNIFLTCPKTKTVKRINRNRVGSTFMKLQGYPRGIAYNPSYDEIIVCLNDSSSTASSNDRMENNAVIRFKVLNSHEKQGYRTEQMDYRFVAYNKCVDLKYLQCPVRVCVNSCGDILFSDFLKRSMVVFDGKMSFKYSIKGEDLFDPANLYRYPVVCCHDNRTFVLCNRSVNTTPNVVVLDSDGVTLRKVYVEVLNGCSIHAAHFDAEDRLLVASDNTVFTFDVQL